MINTVCGVKSTGRICTDLADVLINRGNDVKIAYGRDKAPKRYHKVAIQIGNFIDVYSHTLKSRLFDSCGFESKRTTEKFIAWMKNYNPDIIHLHNLHGYYINLEILFEYLKICNKKIIWTLHDCWAFTGHCSYFSEAKCEQWKTHCSHCCQIKEYPKCLFKGNVSDNYKRKKELFTDIPYLSIVTPSKWLAKQVEHSFLYQYPLKVIPNGIDLEQFKPVNSSFRKKYNLENVKIVLGVATAWGERKGLKEFCELSKHLDATFKIILVGLSKKQIKHLPDNIVKIEKTNSTAELAEIYSAADVFLNLGKEETMGLTTIEAMACGTPVLTSNLTAIPEVVTKQSGIVLKDLKIDTIITGIKSVLNNSITNTRFDAEKYEKNRQYMKYYNLYNEN